MKIYKKLYDLIGNTPLMELSNYNRINKLQSTIMAKLECFNPLSSIKDRVGYALINDAEQKGLINSDTVLIEPTSGNTGIALAFVCASKGYKLVLTMPESMSIERRKLLVQLGAEIVLTPASEGMIGAINKAEEINKQIKNSYILKQFSNPANPRAHKMTTAVEIWNDTEGKIDYFVSGVGSGGTLTGIGEYLKEKNNQIKVIAVEPEKCPILSKGIKGKHGIQGIGAGFVPDNLNVGIIDQIICVDDDNAMKTAKQLAKNEGLLVGISSGAALFAATELAKKIQNKNIVVILPDSGERYISTQLFA